MPEFVVVPMQVLKALEESFKAVNKQYTLSQTTNKPIFHDKLYIVTIMAFWYLDDDFYNPWSELRAMQRRMDSLMAAFDDDFFGFPTRYTRSVPKQITQDPQPGTSNTNNDTIASSKDNQPEEKSITTANTNQQRDLFSFSNFQWRPVWDVKENEKEIVVHVELPGVEKDNLSLKLENNILTLSGEKKHETNEKSDKYHRVERCYGRFCRSIRLPEGVDPASISANYTDGVLTVTVAKPAEAPRPEPMTIEIQRKEAEQRATQPPASSDPSPTTSS
jgi:HSP20 family molecular chaperone IbpA